MTIRTPRGAGRGDQRPRARWGLVPERSYEPELLDRDGHTYEDLADMLREIARVNRWLGGTASVRRPIDAMVRRDGLRAFTLLDVGTGGGEIPRAVVASAKRRGIEARAAGLDLDSHVVRYASTRERSRDPGDEAQAGAGRAAFGATREARAVEGSRGAPRTPDDVLSLLRADGFSLPFPDASFDFVTSSMMFHHFREEAAAALLGELARAARRAVVVNDLVRHRVPWAVIRVLSRFGRSRLVRYDAPLSVLRGWRPDELLAVAEAAGLVPRAQVQRFFPYRLVLVVERASP